MKIKIRLMNWENMNKQGIPHDAINVMKFFNLGLKKDAYPYVPRKSKITSDEIKKNWIPGRNRNISIIAEIKGKIVGSGTVLIDKNSNKYSKESRREPNEYAITIHPDNFDRGIGTKITKKELEEVKKRSIFFQGHIAQKNIRAIRMMEKLGYKPSKVIKSYKRFEDAGIIGKVYLYKFP